MKSDVADLLASVKRALAVRDYAGARTLLRQVLEIDPRNVPAWLNTAGVHRQLNDLDGASALREVLRLDPRNFHALLMNASLLEREGKQNLAASSYGVAIANAPAERYLDAAALQALEHARTVHSRYTSELDDFLRAEVADAQSQCRPPPPAHRFVHRDDIASSQALSTGSVSTSIRVASIRFYEREFPWLPSSRPRRRTFEKDLLALCRRTERVRALHSIRRSFAARSVARAESFNQLDGVSLLRTR
jgi:tetratricopeptide (TPR) repeat protein